MKRKKILVYSSVLLIVFAASVLFSSHEARAASSCNAFNPRWSQVVSTVSAGDTVALLLQGAPRGVDPQGCKSFVFQFEIHTKYTVPIPTAYGTVNTNVDKVIATISGQFDSGGTIVNLPWRVVVPSDLNAPTYNYTFIAKGADYGTTANLALQSGPLTVSTGRTGNVAYGCIASGNGRWACDPGNPPDRGNPPDPNCKNVSTNCINSCRPIDGSLCGKLSTLYGCISDNVYACGTKSDCSDVKNNACAQKQCVVVNPSQCGQTAGTASPKYKCVSGQCVADPNGTFDSTTTCNTSCAASGSGTGTGTGTGAGTGSNGPVPGANTELTIPNPLGCENLKCVTDNIINTLYKVAIPIVAIVVLWGAFQMMTAGGDPEKFKTGRKTILYAAIGFAVVLLASSVSGIIQSIFS